MDPFSIITIIQLTTQASLTLYDFIETLREAKGEIIELGRDVQALTTVLQSLERTLTTPKIRAYLETEAELRAEIASWEGIIQLCKDRVKTLTVILRGCSYRDSPQGKPKVSGVKWYFKRSDALEAQQQLVRTQVTLDNAMTKGVIAILLARAGDDKPSSSSNDPIAERAKQGWQLRRAAKEGDIKAIGMLLDAETSVNSRSQEGRTALSLAAEQGHVETVRFLLSRREVSIDSAMDIVQGSRSKQAESKRTPLHWAAACGHTVVVGLLLDSGAKPDAQTMSQRQPVQEAATYGHIDTVDYLLNRGADVNTKTYYSWTLLHTAATTGRLDLAALVLKHGANTEIAYSGTWHGEGKGENGATHQRPLHYAVRPWRKVVGDETAMIELLVREGKASIAATDSTGATPLHYAVRSKSKGAVSLLLRHARMHEVKLQDAKGRTILQDAVTNGDEVMIAMIETRLRRV